MRRAKKADMYVELAEGLDIMREALNAMVAGLMADGFSEEQARDITTAILTRKPDQEEEADA